MIEFIRGGVFYGLDKLGHLGDHVLLMMLQAQDAIQKRNAAMLSELTKQDDAVDILHAAINSYLSRVGKHTLSEEESQE